MSNIAIVGSGVVGGATGTGLARQGHNVTFVDVDPRRLDALRSRGYAATDELRLTGEHAFVFLALPTPNDGHRWDLAPFERGARAVAKAVAESGGMHTVVVRSTVPPGTAEGLLQPMLEEATGSSHGDGFTLASNPEFLRAACAAEDFLNPSVTVIGSRSKRTLERLHDLLGPFGGEIHRFTDPAVTEFIKCAHNLYNATKISFWNEMWQVGSTLGIEVNDVARIVSTSAEASYNPDYGIAAGEPYGGACLPKDTKGFIGFAEGTGIEMPLLRAVDVVNETISARSDEELSLDSRERDLIASGNGHG